MTINFTMMAQNSDVNYIRQAYACAMSIKLSNPNSKVCLITNDQVPQDYKSVFDDIVEIPWEDTAADSTWKIQNRWKVYHACPYESTIVLDTDILILNDISHWWEYLKSHDLYFVSKTKTYRGEPVTSDYYRKAFVNHKLPNLYTGLYYFKKSDSSQLFFKWLELVMNNWELFHGQYAGGHYFQKFLSMDVSVAIVTKILDWERFVTSRTLDHPAFVHMKPHIQNWNQNTFDTWQEYVTSDMSDDLILTIGNYVQSGIFHYTEASFLTDDILLKYKTALGML